MSVGSNDWQYMHNKHIYTPPAGYFDVSVEAGLTPETTRTILFKISRDTFATMFPKLHPTGCKLQDNWLMTLVCRELGFDDSHIWEVYARAAEEKTHPMFILWNEYDLIKKLEGGNGEQ